MTTTGWSLRRRGSFVLAATLGLVVWADWLFYERPIGWNASLFGLALLLAVALRSPGFLLGTPTSGTGAAGVATARWVLISLLLGLIGALVLQPGVLAVGLGVVGLVMLAVVDRAGWTSSVGRWVWRGTRFVGRGTTQWARDSKLARRWRRQHPGTVKRDGLGAVGVARWFVPIVLALGFVLLFALANPVVQRGVEHVWETVSGRMARLGDGLEPRRVGLWGVTAAACWGLLRTRLRGRSRRRALPMSGERDATTATPEGFRGRGRGRLGDRVASADWVVRCLVLFNLVFAGQTLLDLTYLVSGAELPAGMTYAEYAQRGAYPLVATALLAGAFVLLTFRPGGAAQRSAAARRLVGLWIGQNLLLMVSAAWRLNLYVQAYSLTRWRVAAAVWMLLVAAGFVLLVWRIVGDRDSAWLLRRITLTAAAVLYTLCFLDLDGRIASFNVAHCHEAGGGGAAIDVAYLERLGPEALPAVATLLQTDGLARGTRVEARAAQHELRGELRERMDDWRGWTLRRQWLTEGALAQAGP
jgi:hypothetical protein